MKDPALPKIKHNLSVIRILSAVVVSEIDEKTKSLFLYLLQKMCEEGLLF